MMILCMVVFFLFVVFKYMFLNVFGGVFVEGCICRVFYMWVVLFILE